MQERACKEAMEKGGLIEEGGKVGRDLCPLWYSSAQCDFVREGKWQQKELFNLVLIEQRINSTVIPAGGTGSVGQWERETGRRGCRERSQGQDVSVTVTCAVGEALWRLKHYLKANWLWCAMGREGGWWLYRFYRAKHPRSRQAKACGAARVVNWPTEKRRAGMWSSQ